MAPDLRDDGFDVGAQRGAHDGVSVENEPSKAMAPLDHGASTTQLFHKMRSHRPIFPLRRSIASKLVGRGKMVQAQTAHAWHPRREQGKGMKGIAVVTQE